MDELPSVAGRTVGHTLNEMDRRGRLYISYEQVKINPDSGLIAYLCDAVKMAREYGDTMNTRPSLPVATEEKVNHIEILIRDVEGYYLKNVAKEAEKQLTALTSTIAAPRERVKELEEGIKGTILICEIATGKNITVKGIKQNLELTLKASPQQKEAEIKPDCGNCEHGQSFNDDRYYDCQHSYKLGDENCIKTFEPIDAPPQKEAEQRPEPKVTDKQNYTLTVSDKELMDFTKDWDEHPEWWEIPCLCKLCQSYG